MRPEESAAGFERFLQERGIAVAAAGLDALLGAALDFYATVRVSGATDVDGDTLLFQFGVHDWGEGPAFEIDLTRQFITEAEDVDEEVMSQLRCTVRYDPTPALGALGHGNRWCGERSALPAFRALILASDAYRAALPLAPRRRAIAWSPT